MSVHEDLLNNGENNCSFTEDEVDIMCSKDGDDACGNSHSSDEKSQVNQRVAPICGKNGCVFQFPQKTHAETDLPQG